MRPIRVSGIILASAIGEQRANFLTDMIQRNGAMPIILATKPTAFARLRNYQKENGFFGLVHRLGQVAGREVLTLAALAGYFPSVAIAALKWKLRPRKTTERIVEGDRRFQSGRFAIFLVYQPKQTPWYVENALRALAATQTNVLLVFNHPVDEERLARFRQDSFRIMIRNNTGLDIGGYRDGYLALHDEPSLERLLILNDSVYFFERGLQAFFERLMSSTADISAPYENRQFHYHVQSFCISLSRRMATCEGVKRFFEDYIPVNSRRWAIHMGEIGLSDALTQSAESIEILYSTEHLVSYSGPLPAAFTADPASFLPIGLRMRYQWLRTQPEALSEAPLVTVARLTPFYSQIHTVGFLFQALFGCPLMKRDIFYRQQFSLEDVRSAFEIIDVEGHGDAIIADLARKGDGGTLRGLDQGRYAAGMI